MSFGGLSHALSTLVKFGFLYSDGIGTRLTKIEDAWDWQFTHLGPVLQVEHTERYASVRIKNPMYEYGVKDGPESIWIHVWTWEDRSGAWRGTSTWSVVYDSPESQGGEENGIATPERQRRWPRGKARPA